jgi:4-amino-4-deoxychorismate lyase
MSEVISQTKTALVYFDGALRPSAAARFAVDDHGVLFGLGFFETFRTSGGRPHDWKRHRVRLLRACSVAGIRLPDHFLAHNETRLSEIVRELLAHEGAVDAVFRYTITAGPETAHAAHLAHDARDSVEVHYRSPSELLAMRPLAPAARSDGIVLRVLNLRRDSGEWEPRPKSLNHANAILGARERDLRATSADDDGLFLDRFGRIVETPRRNLGWFRDGVFHYPAPSVGPIGGTGLEWSLENLSEARAVEAPLSELQAADAVIVMNSVRGITPVREIWDRTDRERLWSAPSSEHPQVRELIARWQRSLEETATNAVNSSRRDCREKSVR